MSSEIKSVIGLLCKQLNMMLNTNLKPEHFRLAKFDKTEDNVIPVLWTTLCLLTTKERQPDVERIKNYMRSLNYDAEMFYSLPEDFSSGSREVLVAVAFIVARNFPALIKEEINKSPFEDSYSLLDLGNIQVHRPEIPDLISESDKKNYLMWLKGRIQQNKRMTEEYKAQSTKIYEKLNDLLNTKASSKLSLNEVLALSSMKYSKEFLEKCKHVMNLLECYQEWTRKEKVFWKWMVTVLAERE